MRAAVLRLWRPVRIDAFTGRWPEWREVEPPALFDCVFSVGVRRGAGLSIVRFASRVCVESTRGLVFCHRPESSSDEDGEGFIAVLFLVRDLEVICSKGNS